MQFKDTNITVSGGEWHVHCGGYELSPDSPIEVSFLYDVCPIQTSISHCLRVVSIAAVSKRCDKRRLFTLPYCLSVAKHEVYGVMAIRVMAQNSYVSTWLNSLRVCLSSDLTLKHNVQSHPLFTSGESNPPKIWINLKYSWLFHNADMLESLTECISVYSYT